MKTEILLFIAIAVARIFQSYSGKKRSDLLPTKHDVFHFTYVYYLISAASALISSIIYGFDVINYKVLICSALAGICFTVSIYCGIEALKLCSIAFATLFISGSLFVPCVVGHFFFDEKLTIYTIICLVVFVASTVIYTLGKKNDTKVSKRAWILLIVQFLSEGLIMVVQKYYATYVPEGNSYVFSLFTFLIAAILAALIYVGQTIKKKKTEENYKFKLCFNNKKLYLYAAMQALAIFIISTFVTTLAETVPSYLLFPISTILNILINVVVGRLIFKEKVTLFNIIGLILGAASIVVMYLL